MLKTKTVLAIIPARGGSKGLPKKNISILAGKPLIAWTIETAIESRCFNRIIVNTDSQEIAEIGMEYGAEIPFLRPMELASDQTKGIDVIVHTMNWFENQGEQFDLLIVLQPTSPLRNSSDIKCALNLFLEKNADSVVSVCESEHSPLWMNTIDSDLSMKNFLKKEITNINRQELKTYYRLNGAIYIANWNYLKNKQSFFGDQTYAYIMPQERSVDIDTELDLQYAEFLLKNNT